MGKTGFYRKGGRKRPKGRRLAGSACLGEELNYLSEKIKKEDFG